MISKVFSLRNYVMKQIMKTTDEGIMQIPDKGKIDFGEMIIREDLFKKGIDPKTITSESQLDNILNTPNVSPKSTPKKSGEVIEVDFDKGRWKDIDPEKKAGGGRTGTGLNYLLGEDDQNVRMPFAAGGFNAARRLFLQAVGAGAAGIGAAKSGLFGLLKGGGKKEVIKELTQVPIKDISGMPAWFKPLVNQVIKKGDDVTKKFATQERQIVHKAKLPDSQTDVLVTQDLTTGDVAVDIGIDKHGFSSGKFGQPVRLEYKAAEVLEGPIKKGKPTKTKEEFWVEEAEFTGGHPENVKFEESVSSKFGKHESDFTEVEKFATGAVKKIKKASGGRVPLFGGGAARKLWQEFIEKLFLKASNDIRQGKGIWQGLNQEQWIKKHDDLTKVLKEWEMGGKKALPKETKEFFGMNEIQLTNKFKIETGQIQASRPTKTLEGIEKTGTINISDPAIADEFTRFMKETDPKGHKKIEEIVEITNFDPKGRKKNAFGGLAGMLGE